MAQNNIVRDDAGRGSHLNALEADQRRFGALYDATATRVWLLALALTSDPDAARALLTRTYIAAWHALRAAPPTVTADTLQKWLLANVRAAHLDRGSAPDPSSGPTTPAL